MNKIEKDIVIIGAGLTGLTIAYYLNQSNKDFTVIEEKKQHGGVIQTKKQNGFLFETGPNTGIISQMDATNLFKELDSDICIEIPGDNVKKRFIAKSGKLEVVPSGFMQGITTPLFTFFDKLRLLGEPFRKSGNDPFEDLASLVTRRMGKSFLDYAIDPFILGVFAGDPKKLIPKYAFPKLYQLEQEYGSFIGGTIKKKFAERSNKEEKPSRKVYSFSGGLSTLTDALFMHSKKNNFRFGINNSEIQYIDNKFLINFIDEKSQKVSISAKQLIITSGAHKLNTILPFTDKTTQRNLSSLPYADVVEVTIGFNKWNGIELDGFGCLIPSCEKRKILGILFMSSLFKGRAPQGGALLTIFMGGVRKPDVINLSDEIITEMVKEEILSLLKINEFNPDLFEIHRHKYAIPQYGKESEERIKTINNIENTYPGLIIGGNLKDGIGMSDRIKQGRTIANKICNT